MSARMRHAILRRRRAQGQQLRRRAELANVAPWQPEYKRWDVVNRVAAWVRPSRYLEIGVADGSCLRRIAAPEKWAVDPTPQPNAVQASNSFSPVTSDEFFARAHEGFDLVFIDAVHEHEQVYRDVMNSLAELRPGGALVLDDCNPKSEIMQRWPPEQDLCTGNVWIAIARLRAERPDLHVRVVDTDYGLGVVVPGRQGPPELALGMPYDQLSWPDFVARRQELLGLVGSDEWESWFASCLGVQPELTFGALTMIRFDLMAALLRSVLAGDLIPNRWHIVDNGGGWSRYAMEHKIELPGEVIVEHFGRNIGVAAGWNRIIDRAPGPVVIANDDLTVAPSTLSRLADAGQQHPIVFAHSFGLFYFEPAIMLGRVGYFDENMLVYYEDIEYQRRMALAGVPVIALDGKCHHVGSATLPALRVEQPKLSQQYYFAKWGAFPDQSSAPFADCYVAAFNGAVPQNWQLRPVQAGA